MGLQPCLPLKLRSPSNVKYQLTFERQYFLKQSLSKKIKVPIPQNMSWIQWLSCFWICSSGTPFVSYNSNSSEILKIMFGLPFPRRHWYKMMEKIQSWSVGNCLYLEYQCKWTLTQTHVDPQPHSFPVDLQPKQSQLTGETLGTLTLAAAVTCTTHKGRGCLCGDWVKRWAEETLG